jgi:lipopolysaccharide/colanic/teichoic acid biosynthesis glycosyltransferase
MSGLPSTIRPEELLADLEAEGAAAACPAGGAGYLLAKRALDIFVAGAFLLALSPLILLVAALIKLASPSGPILFRQTRAGKDNQPFEMIKFRTMKPGAEEDREFLGSLNRHEGPVFKIPDDPRLIRFGRFLRRSSIDELPQLLNVLRGEMTLVGPRPLWWPEAQAAQGVACLRTRVRPGLTCLWQISGRSELTYHQWVLLDLYYVRHRSFWLDLMILIQTIPAVLSGHGAY